MNAERSYRWVAWLAFALVVLCAAGALSAGLGYRLQRWPYGMGFRILAWSAGLCVPVLAVCLFALIANLGRDRQAVAASGLGLVLGLVVILVPVQWKLLADRLPAIHDISTDTDDPPLLTAASRLRAPSDHPVTYEGAALALKQHSAYPDVRPLFSRAPKQRIFELGLAVMRSQGFDVVASNPGPSAKADATIEAVATTRLFGFKDDMAVRIRCADGACRVDARSMSRVGRSDLGENARRVRRFLITLREKLGENS